MSRPHANPALRAAMTVSAAGGGDAAVQPAPSRRDGLSVRLLATMLAMGLATAMVMFGSYAAWTDQTTNPGNTVTAGALSIDNDKDGVAVFTATGVVPGDSGSDTVTIENDGTVPAQVFLTQSGLSASAIEADLRLAIYDAERDYCYYQNGGPAAGPCGALAPWNGTATINDLQIMNASGGTHWAVNDSHTFTVYWEFDSAAGNATQGQTGTFDLTWDATE